MLIWKIGSIASAMEKKHGPGQNKKAVSGDTHGGGTRITKMPLVETLTTEAHVQLLEKQDNRSIVSYQSQWAVGRGK
jgi:hypothetical protein